MAGRYGGSLHGAWTEQGSYLKLRVEKEKPHWEKEEYLSSQSSPPGTHVSKRPHLLGLPNSDSNWWPNIQMPERIGGCHSNQHTRVSGRLAVSDNNPGICHPTTIPQCWWPHPLGSSLYVKPPIWRTFCWPRQAVTSISWPLSQESWDLSSCLRDASQYLRVSFHKYTPIIFM